MQSDFLDRKLYKMAEQEQMAVSEDLDARVDDILQHLEAADTITASGGRRSWRQPVWCWLRLRWRHPECIRRGWKT